MVYYLHAASPLAPAAPEKLPKELNGHPVAYFWADGIRTGRYIHPAGKFELHVDAQRLDTWTENFHRMRAAGLDVPVPVDHSQSARDNLGYVVDVKREGDTLKLLHQLIGDDAIKLAARNKVSLGIDPQFADGHGTLFGDCVVHSSLTPIPVVPNQSGFLPMSAHPGDHAAPIIFHLAADSPHAQEHAHLFRRRLDALVTDGRVAPACRDRLMNLMAPRDRPSTILLSRDGTDLLDDLLSALQQNRALTLGERTGLQTLSRSTPGEESPVDPTLQTKMVRMANGK
jgi:hypothetical protein